MLSQGISQIFPNAQSKRIVKNITDAEKEFVDRLIVKNNEYDGDDGVRKVILALAGAKNLKTGVKKDELVATLGFLNGLNFEEANTEYKKILMDDIRSKVIDKFNTLKPRNCDICRCIYNDLEGPDCMECFICDKRICPSCLPIEAPR